MVKSFKRYHKLIKLQNPLNLYNMKLLDFIQPTNDLFFGWQWQAKKYPIFFLSKMSSLRFSKFLPFLFCHYFRDAEKVSVWAVQGEVHQQQQPQGSPQGLHRQGQGVQGEKTLVTSASPITYSNSYTRKELWIRIRMVFAFIFPPKFGSGSRRENSE